MDALTAILFVIGMGLLIAGGELLVRGASRLAGSFGISPLVIGLTVVAFGTSSPEFAVSIGSVLSGEPDLVVGNVVGSNIYNVLLVLGLAAVVAPPVVGQQLILRDVPLMVLVSAAVILLAVDGGIGRFDGLLLAGALVAWIVFSLWQGRRQSLPPEEVEKVPAVEVTGGGGRLRNLGLIVLGLVLLTVGARWLVDGAIAVATALGFSSLVIGLTVVAVGTSLPEIATSVIAGLRGQRDIAVGNVVGSNLFNLLGVLGLTALVGGDIPVAVGALTFDLPVMLGVAIACLPIFFSGHRIGRREGALFLAYGVGYTVYLLANALEHPRIPALTESVATVVLPLTFLTVVVIAVRQLRKRGLGGEAPGR